MEEQLTRSGSFNSDIMNSGFSASGTADMLKSGTADFGASFLAPDTWLVLLRKQNKIR